MLRLAGEQEHWVAATLRKGFQVRRPLLLLVFLISYGMLTAEQPATFSSLPR